MIIHVVLEGETIQSISNKYHIPAQRLILENGITNPDHLVIGQAIVIVYPLITYKVQDSESIAAIAIKNGVTVMQILRNNPYLSDREILYPGETIVISYDTDKIRTIATSGYAYPYINRDILRKTLPFLTYLTIFNYRVTQDGTLIDIDDREIIDIAKSYGVAPMMLVSTLSDRGVGSTEITNNILTKPEVQNRLINTTLNTLKEKGYYGLNIYLQYLRPENLTLEAAFISNFSQRLHSEGFRIIVTVTPRTNIQGTEISYELFDYTTIAQNVDGMLFLSYDWAYSFGPPASATPMNIVEEVLIHTLESVPPEKIFLGFPIIGYDWQLPYIPGYSMARAVTTDIAIELASITNSIIRYNEISQAPYFFYFNEAQENHIVWFKDGRSIDALAGLVPKYDLQGLSIWNIMRFFAQMWFVLNTQYDFAKVDLKKEPSEK